MKRILVIFSFALPACTITAVSPVQQRAAYDLTCPAEQLQITEIGPHQYGVQGCGKRQSYTCIDRQCIPERQGNLSTAAQ
jgi:hypothetical protein